MTSINVTGKNIDITESIIVSVNQAFKKLSKKFPKMTASVVVSNEKNGIKVVSTFTGEHGAVLNSTGFENVFSVALKCSVRKLTSQLRAIKTNIIKKRKTIAGQDYIDQESDV